MAVTINFVMYSLFMLFPFFCRVQHLWLTSFSILHDAVLVYPSAAFGVDTTGRQLYESRAEGRSQNPLQCLATRLHDAETQEASLP